ncbi:MAG: aminoacyl-tRNA hydrolase [Hyphomicrobiaceae bacterium]|nr:MAG: aminoacyl-tRNA hydrolase [Hyphomicrobiaceae bacterium]KAB2851828.1 MAG: aminoacyl-tRNA hydrolase [Hyphomicrobiaceae bacterium]
MKLFVGLGNPGAEYVRHRHNVGFMALQRIADRHGLGPWRKRFHGLACEGMIAGRRAMLLQPQTFMNDSGRSVGEAQRYLKIAEADVVVFHDELDLAPGKIKVKTGGGNAGHNGLRSISAHIGNEYARVRIGIGHPGSKELVHGYVLHDFAKDDAAWLDPLLDAIADAAGRLAGGDEARFLTDVARAARGREDAAPALAASRPERKPAPVAASAGRHPAGERQAKRSGALAENLKRWLTGRRTES